MKLNQLLIQLFFYSAYKPIFKLKKFFLFLLIIISFISSSAQNNMGIGTNTPDASSVLDISANDKGVLVPRLTTQQRQNIPNPFSKTTIIPFILENDMNDVAILVTDLTGKTLINLPVVAIKGENKIEINSSQLYQGVFIYHLSVSGSVVDSKRMVVK